MYSYNLKVEGKKLTPIDDIELRKGAYNIDELSIEFDESWSDYNEIVGVFFVDKQPKVRAILDGKCVVPKAAYTQPQTPFGIIGKKIEDDEIKESVSTNLISLLIRLGGDDTGGDPSEDVPDPSQWEIYIQQIERIVEELKQRIPTKLSQLENDCGFIDANKATMDMRKIEDYLYEVTYRSVDYDAAYEYFETQQDDSNNIGLCTSVRKGNWYGRNLDWLYDEAVDFVVHVPRLGNRFASVGMGNAGALLSKSIVEEKKYNFMYQMLPFMVVDGINEHGVFVNTNVVPLDKGETTGTIPEENIEIVLQSKMVPRYILDHFTTATEAVNYFKKHVSLYTNPALLKSHFEPHFMIGDKDHTYIMETRENVLYIKDMSPTSESDLANRSYMSNFYLTDIRLNEDGTVITPETQEEGKTAKSYNLITDHGAGLERYNFIVNNFDNLTTESDMINLMNNLIYTNAYRNTTNPFWYSEFAEGNLTVESSVEDFATAKAIAIEYFENRSRNPEEQYYGTWQTVHSCVYDIENRSFSIRPQEENVRYYFELVYNYNAREIDEKLERKQDKLISGTNIKTINNQSILGAGNIEIISENCVWEKGIGKNSVITKGNNNNAIGEASVAEGAETDAHSYASHTEGYMTSTGISADYSHTEGYKTSTQGQASHAEGDSTITNNPAEHAEGRYNKSNMGGTSESNTLHSVGIGNASGSIPGGERRNAFEIMQNGDTYLYNTGNYDGTNPTEANTLQKVISNKQEKLIAGDNIVILNNVISAVGASDIHYVHNQEVARDRWVINHNLLKYPSVSVVDEEGSLVFGEIEYTDENNLVIRFSEGNPQKGKAYLN